MPIFHHIRFLALAIAAALVMQSAPAEAATKSRGKISSSKKSGKSGKKSASTKSSQKKSYAKTPPKKIDIAKLVPAESLYRKREAAAPASRSLSFFGSLASAYRYDSRMLRAAEIATARAYAHSHGSCWRYVKDALLDAGVVDSRPKTGYAKQAADELTDDFGFRRISCSDPFKAPPGSVLVYGGRGAGHVEFRTKTGFVSDFTTPNPSKRPLIGVYVKP
jgi:opacity protein-like surface antigen